ncbi:cytochrome P450 [Streptomyces sp. ST2-7A]|uniref:cytochrome P450 family protein n=1 Tax=Streptomyces sp. ST2-7A TaxID=2907214 RepID=UPI001F48F4D4|nr:cytochrome P450 [Streptomyces sp. ST2-7A]MCE7080128.1 cytochrome P450 [Streptomyces sp. ST2-7A]
MTHHDLIKQLTVDRRVSRDPRRHWPALADVPRDWPLNVWVRVTSAFTSYGAEHRRLRKLISVAFTPHRTREMRPKVEAIVATLMDHLVTAAESGLPVDLRAHFAHPIPTEVICDLFGVPEDMRPETRRVIDAALDTAATPEQAAADFTDLLTCMSALVTTKRARPGPDMTSDLIAARDGSDQLDEEQLISTLILMIGAGSETAVNLITEATLALLTHPDHRAALAAGTITREDVIEETLRWQSPIMHMPLRYAVEDIDLGDGMLIRRGEAILLAFGAAGRDPALHGATADDFDPTRADKEHLAFGHGVHYCLGAPLARMEADIALRSLFARFPRMRLAVPRTELRPQQSFIANSHQELPVILDPTVRPR